MIPDPTHRSSAGVRAWRPLLWFAGVKAAYLGLSFLALALWRDLDAQQFLQVNARWPRSGDPVFATHFATWDAAHYLYLSEIGYQAGAASCAFYPLWPWLMRTAAPLAGGNHLGSGLALANVASLAAWTLLHRCVARRWGTSSANWTLAFFLMNHFWTFRGMSNEPGSLPTLLRHLWRFHAICGIGIFLSVACLRFLHCRLGLPVCPANLLAVLLATLWNFGANAGLNWGPQRTPRAMVGPGT